MTVFVMLGVFDEKNVQCLDEKFLAEEVAARLLKMCARHLKLGLRFQPKDYFHEQIMFSHIVDG